MKTLIKLKFGSDLYGCRTATSDTDWKGVHVPSATELVMQNAQSVISKSTGSSAQKNTADDIDDESFSVLKFFSMLRKGDMVAAEILFTNPDQAFYMSDEWKSLIIPNREKLIARDIKGFVGYIRTQCARYGIRGSRVATSRNASDLFLSWINQYGPTTKVKDVPNYLEHLTIFASNNDHSQFVSLPVAKGSKETVEYFEAVNRKVGYTIALKEAHAIYKRAFDEFGSRALAAEKNEGVDFKAVYHAIRVSEQALELLRDGTISFPRHNARELLTIKRGEQQYSVVASRLEANLDELERLMPLSTLPEKVDEDFMNALIHELHLSQIKRFYF